MAVALYTNQIRERLLNEDALSVLAGFEAVGAQGRQPTLALLDSATMKRLSRSLALLERGPEGSLRVLVAGPDVPDSDGTPIAGRSVSELTASVRGFYQRGAEAAFGRDAAVLAHFRAPINSRVHRWEALFLPLAEKPDTARSLVAVLCAPLEYKHDFLRAVLDAMPPAALIVEPESRGAPMAIAHILSANAAAVTLLGQPSLDSLLACPLAEAFAQPDIDNGWMRLVAEMQPESTARFDYNHRAATGTLWFDVRISPFGESSMLITLTDITELKRMVLDLDHQRKALLEEMEQRRTLEQELWALAHLDPLTGLPNRRAFRDDAQALLVSAQTLERPCALISLDIDHFKRVNDTHGHGAGDLVLRRVADILKAPLRPEVDIAARMGGEEFSVFLPDTELEGARAFAEMLRHRIEHTVVIAGDAEIRPTVSLGIAMVLPRGDLDSLLDRSDRALYAAKRSGRNRVMAEDDLGDPEKVAA